MPKRRQGISLDGRRPFATERRHQPGNRHGCHRIFRLDEAAARRAQRRWKHGYFTQSASRLQPSISAGDRLRRSFPGKSGSWPTSARLHGETVTSELENANAGRFQTSRSGVYRTRRLAESRRRSPQGVAAPGVPLPLAVKVGKGRKRPFASARPRKRRPVPRRPEHPRNRCRRSADPCPRTTVLPSLLHSSAPVFQTRSITVAIPCPTPMHMVQSARLPPLRSSS